MVVYHCHDGYSQWYLIKVLNSPLSRTERIAQNQIQIEEYGDLEAPSQSDDKHPGARADGILQPHNLVQALELMVIGKDAF